MFFKSSITTSLESLAGVYAPREDDSHLLAKDSTEVVGQICSELRKGTVVIDDRQTLLSLRRFIQEHKSSPHAIVELVRDFAGQLPIDFKEKGRSCERIVKSLGRLFLEAVKNEHSLLKRNFNGNISPRDGHFFNIDPAAQNCLGQLNYLKIQVADLSNPAFSPACRQLGIPDGKLLSLYKDIENTESRCRLQIEKRQEEIKIALTEEPEQRPLTQRFSMFLPPRFFGFHG